MKSWNKKCLCNTPNTNLYEVIKNDNLLKITVNFYKSSTLITYILSLNLLFFIMSNFGKLLSSHLAEQLSVSENDVIEALNSFTTEKKPVSSIKKKNPPSTIDTKILPKNNDKTPTSAPTKKTPTTKNSPTVEQHVCCRVKRGKTECCGAPAKKSITVGNKTEWYCGSEKAGCYKIKQNEIGDKALKDDQISNMKSSGAKTKSVNAKPTLAQGKSVADENSKSLIKKVLEQKSAAKLEKVIEQKELDVIKKNTKLGKLWMDKSTRALVDKENNNEFYGILSEDDSEILPIDDKTLRWLEGNNCNIRRPTTQKTQAKHINRETKKVIDEPKEESSSSEEIVELSSSESEEAEATVTSCGSSDEKSTVVSTTKKNTTSNTKQKAKESSSSSGENEDEEEESE